MIIPVEEQNLSAQECSNDALLRKVLLFTLNECAGKLERNIRDDFLFQRYKYL